MLTDPVYLALLEAIRQDLQDDTLRLIAADRLEELGEDTHAELVRVQIELTKIPKTRPVLYLLDTQIKSAKTAPAIGYGGLTIWENSPIDHMWVSAPLLTGRLPEEQVTKDLHPGVSVLVKPMSNTTEGFTTLFYGTILMMERAYSGNRVLFTIRLESTNHKETEGVDKRSRLEERQQQLISSIKPLWNALQSSAFVFVYRRGFIEEIMCLCQGFMEHGAMIYQQCPTLQKVVLTDKQPFYLPSVDSSSVSAPERFIWQCYPGDYYATTNSPDHLPEKLFQWLAVEVIAEENYCAYPSQQAALDGLNRACLRYVQSQKPVVTP